MVIAHNLAAYNTQRQYNIVTNRKQKTTEKLSSGYKINRASDDAAGLSISEKMRRQIRGLSQGTENTQDGVSLCQVADGALAEVNDMLHRITELSVQSANGTNADSDRQAIQNEISQILSEINRIGDTTTFNTMPLFTGQTDKVTIPAEYAPTTATNFAVTGTPTDTTSTSYSISANNTGFKINGESFSWNQMTDGAGNTLAGTPVAGTYSMNYHGMSLSVDVENNADMKDIAGLLNGATFSSKVTAGTMVDRISVSYINGIYNNTMGDTSSNTIKFVCEGTKMTLQSDLPYTTPSISSDFQYGMMKDGIVKAGSYRLSFGRTATMYEDCNVTIEIDVNADTTVDDFNSIFNNAILSHYGSDSAPDKMHREYVTGITLNNGGKVEIGGGTSVDSFKDSEYKGDLVKPAEDKYSDENLKLWIQSGAEAGSGMFLEIDRMNATILNINGLDVSTEAGANDALDKVPKALAKLMESRSKIGAQQNRLEHTIANNENAVENTTDAESRIRDTDMAKEMVEFSKDNILTMVGESMMAQANQSNQGVLSLLG